MARGLRQERETRHYRYEAIGSTRNYNTLEGASSVSCVINLLNTSSGLLASPHSLSQMGILVGTFIILWSGLTAGFGLFLQARCARYLERGTSSFFAISQITYPRASIIFDSAIVIKCFGVGVSYLIIIGDLMPSVINGLFEDVEASTYLVDRKFWITAFMLVVIPLTFLRRLDSLRYTSIVALVSIAYLVVLIFYHFIRNYNSIEMKEIRVIKSAGVVPSLKSFPVIVFAYTCHQNMFSILNETGSRNHKNITTIIRSSIGTAALIYILVAITGYLSFGNGVAGNIVGMFGSTIGKAAIVLLSTFSYPLQVHPCRASVDAVMRWRSIQRESHSHLSEESPVRSVPFIANQKRQIAWKESMSELRFALITTIIIILSYTVAMTISSLDKVLTYVGCTGSTSISYILPGLFYYKISSPNYLHRQWLLKEDDIANEPEGGLLHGDSVKPSRWIINLRTFSLALAIYGIIIMGVCLGINIFGSAN